MNERIKSVRIENVDCVIGRNTKKPNTVVMSVHENFIMEALKLYQIQKRGENPTEGLIGLELRAVYAEDEQEEKEAEKLIDGMGDSLESVVDEKSDEERGLVE